VREKDFEMTSLEARNHPQHDSSSIAFKEELTPTSSANRPGTESSSLSLVCSNSSAERGLDIPLQDMQGREISSGTQEEELTLTSSDAYAETEGSHL
jgi:hypothetical protein